MVPSSLAALVSSPLVVPGVPGAPELLVILLVGIVVFGLPLLIVAGAVVYFRRDETIEELEERIADLESERAVRESAETGDSEDS
jgi:sec-independent protein translocase protein TatA